LFLESSKKYNIDMSQNNPLIPQQFAISDEDIQKMADALKSKWSEDIVKIINEKTAPLIANYLAMFNYSGSLLIWFTNSG
jgi:hypothetical protein